MAVVIRKAITKFNTFRGRQKVPENWGSGDELVKDGMSFYVKYLGSTLVEDITEPGRNYGNSGICATAIRTIVTMAKRKGVKLPKTRLYVSPKGVKVTDMVSQEIISNFEVQRIRFCSADGLYTKVCALICRNDVNDTMECHGYLCSKAKMAKAITLTIAHSFSIARDQKLADESNKKNNSIEITQLKEAFFDKVSGRKEDQLVEADVESDSQYYISSDQPYHHFESSFDDKPAIDLRDNVIDSRPGPPVTTNDKTVKLLPPPGLDVAPINRSVSAEFDNQPSSSQNWETFGGEEPRRLTELTDISMESLDSEMMSYFNSKRNLDEFQRQPSVDDLLNL